ncbi:hypothetical protein ACJRPK_13850 [Aquimarina sp. 2-A2]|uniref:hypothetical protein n=1 Tax=Aquimarina sp. 2-A2 TaxID=3382644 RepID=UPI00387F370E
MKKLRIHRIFRDLFATLPTYQINSVESDPIFYHLGDQDELNKVLLTRQVNQQKAYPLLWYKLPNSYVEGEGVATGTFTFILATNTSADLFNDQRFETVFDTVLYPNLSLVLQAFTKANNIQLNKFNNENTYFKSTEYPDYGKLMLGTGDDPLDYWDAMSFDVNLRITDNCQGTINYNLKDII